MAQSRYWTVLHEAVSNGDVQLVQQVLNASDGNELLNKKDASGWTPLIVAARMGHLPTLRVLLKDPRMQLEARDDSKCTALRHALGTGHNAAACELLMAGADARNGLLPFIMLDTYNRLMAHMETATAELEAELEPHRILRHRLALLLHKHGIAPPTKATKQLTGHMQRVDAASMPDTDAQRHSDRDQRLLAGQKDVHVQQAQLKPFLKGVQRDAAEIEQAAQRIKQLKQELEPLRQSPVPPAMVHAIVSLVQAAVEAEGVDGYSSVDQQVAEQTHRLQRSVLSS